MVSFKFKSKSNIRKGHNVSYGTFASYRNLMCIYAIKCKITNKVYIGSTTNLQHRLSKHFSYLSKGTHRTWELNEDFKKYGKDEFTFEVLEEVFDKSLLKEKEREYQINAGIDNIYNLKVSNYYIDERLRKLHVNINTSHFKTKEYREKLSKAKSNRIAQYNKDTYKLIKIYNNMNEILVNNPNFKGQPIRGVCNGSKKTAYGYYWKYVDDNGNILNNGYKHSK